MTARVAGRTGSILAFALGALVAAAGACFGESLTTSVSQPAVKITSNFTGAEIVVFGVVERDAVTVERPDPYDIVVVISGPKENVVTRRKDRVFGVWVNNQSVRFVAIPSFYALHSTRKLEEIADPMLLEARGIGSEYLPIEVPDESDAETARVHEFREALLRLKLQEGLYAQRSKAVVFLSPSLFRTTIPLPANVPDGDYNVEVSLFRGGAILAQQQQKLRIGKAGFEQFTYTMAQSYSLFYGLATVLMALATGWLAGVIFRRE